MKKLTLVLLFILTYTQFMQAKDIDYIDKIINLYNITSSGSVEYNATRVEDGYNLQIKPKDEFFKDILSNKPIHIKVDEGPIVTSPHFTFAKAGMSAKGLALDLLNPKLVGDINSSLKNKPNYIYEGKVTFGGELEESLSLEPLDIDTKDMLLKTSKIISKSSFDLDTITGENSIKIDKIELKPKEQNVGDMRADGVNIKVKVTQEPIDNIMLFSNVIISADKLHFKAKDKNSETNFSLLANIDSKRVDSNLLDSSLKFNFKALDEATIALAKGVKDLNLNIAVKNLGIKGMLALAKLQKEYNKLNHQMIDASKKGDEIAMQKAILANQELTNKLVPIWNNTMIADKTRVVANLEAVGQKRSALKLNLLYKGKPLSGDANSAFISLAAQQLNLFDGDIEIDLDSNLATSINPLAMMGLSMLVNKHFATQKDGVYHLKAQLKGGKIVINGKAYALPELAKALF